MSDFLKEWQENISPVLTRWVAQTADHLQATRGETVMLRSSFHPRNEHNFDYGTVFISVGDDSDNLKAVSFTVTYNDYRGREFYKLCVEAHSSFEEKSPMTAAFEDRDGMSYECRFYRNSDNFKLRVEQETLDQIFCGSESLIQSISAFPVEVLHDILNVALNTVAEREAMFGYSYGEHGADYFGYHQNVH